MGPLMDLEEQGNKGIIPGEKVNKNLQMRGTWEQRQFWRPGNIGNEDLDFGEQGNKTMYFRGTRKQVPPLGLHACLDN